MQPHRESTLEAKILKEREEKIRSFECNLFVKNHYREKKGVNSNENSGTESIGYSGDAVRCKWISWSWCWLLNYIKYSKLQSHSRTILFSKILYFDFIFFVISVSLISPAFPDIFCVVNISTFNKFFRKVTFSSYVCLLQQRWLMVFIYSEYICISTCENSLKIVYYQSMKK